MSVCISRISFADAFWFQEGPGVRNTQFRYEGIKLLNVSNITKDGQIDLQKTDRHLDKQEALGKYKHFLIDEGDLVIASSGIPIDEDGLLRTRGAFIESQHLPLCMNTSTIRFKAKNGISDLSYLRHWLQSLDFRTQITRLVTGSAQKNFGPTHLKVLTIPSPPLEEQKRIAAILDQADDLRRKRQRALDRLNQLGQAIFVEMFGDLLRNDKAWPSGGTLGDHAEIASGITKGRDAKGRPTRSVPYLAVVNVQDKRLQLDAPKEIEATEEEISRHRLQPGDLLLTEGGDPDKLGRGTLWNAELPECIHQNHVFRVRLSSKKYNPIFLNWLVGSAYGKGYFLRSAKQTTGIASINMSQLKAFPMLLPPIGLQDDFAKKLKKIDEEVERLAGGVIASTNLFTSLQHRAFRGELTAPR